ncbi:MAG: TerB family tellurite resistance protein [Sulfurospirillaceae bacterium]|nr:TerB family tellurite resistance protein [Sulfurospirillaceae bacterium]MDD2826524.1 TerB family tellurite resistance protein [Sulfurospirillaceae bacterium]
MGLFDKVNGDMIQEKLSQGLSDAVEKVSNERETYYKNHSNPSKNEISQIIQSYGNKNAVISGGAGMIPGPWGMAASIPEIVAVIKNQMSMIYDVAKAHGHQKVEKELIIAVLFGAVGNAATSLIVVHGQKIMVKKVGARALQNIIKILGGKVTQQMAKSMAAKWVPFAGAIAMATWSKYSTHQIGNKAIEVFSRSIEFENDEMLEVSAPNLAIENTDLSGHIAKVKIQTLINLMKIDGNIDDKEVNYIQNFIEKSNLSNEDEMQLIEQLGSSDKIKVDYSVLKDNQEDGLYLLIDLIALAKVDEKFHVTEKMFIKNIAKTIGFNEDDLTELIN